MRTGWFRALPLAGIVLATGLFVALHALLGAVADPTGFYAPGVEPVLPAGGSPAPGRASLPPAVVLALLEAPFVEVAVPETFVYTVVNELPVIVRGGPLDQLLKLHGARVIAGELPAADAPALLVGERLARRLHVETGDVLMVPASSGSDLLVAPVAGLVRAGTGLRDEILVDTSTGLRLAGLSAGAANFLEVRPRDDRAMRDWLAHTRDAPRLDVQGPAASRAGANVTLRVVDARGMPVADAILKNDGAAEARTDALGSATVVATAGRTRWLVEVDGQPRGEHLLLGVLPDADIVVTKIEPHPAFPFPRRVFLVDVHVISFANASAARNLSLRVDGAEVAAASVSLPPHGQRVVTLTVPAGVDTGTYALSVDDLAVSLVVATPDELQAQWRLVSPTSMSLRSTTMRDALDDVFGSIALAALLLGLLAFLLFFVGNAALFARLVHEREGDLILLRALGASRAQVRLFALRALGLVALLSTLVGLLLGVLAAEAFTRFDVLTLFGHTLRIAYRPGSVLTTVFLALLCTVGAVALAVEAFLRRENAHYNDATISARPATLAEVLT